MGRKLILVFMGIAMSVGLYGQPAPAQEQIETKETKERIERSYKLFFRLNRADLDRSYMGNGKTLDAMKRELEIELSQDNMEPETVLVITVSSPEGPKELNARLAHNRAVNARRLLTRMLPQFPPQDIKEVSRIDTWNDVLESLRYNNNLKYKDIIMQILTNPDIVDKDAELRKYPKVFEELRSVLLEQMRTASITVSVIKTRTYLVNRIPKVQDTPQGTAQHMEKKEAIQFRLPDPVPEPLPPFYMSVKTNLLYDAVLVPNLGVEFYLGNDWSITANWMHAWWRHEIKHKYWRIYGGDLGVRKWFGRAAAEKPLTGHHAGIYGQMLTYDFENGGRGYMGGEPGGTILDKANYVGGLEYGYALPIGKRLNLDFVIGVGYMGGKYHEYVPIDGHYVWQVTKKRSWFGPTKAEVSLVWLLGRGNINKNKGGRR